MLLEIIFYISGNIYVLENIITLTETTLVWVKPKCVKHSVGIERIHLSNYLVN